MLSEKEQTLPGENHYASRRSVSQKNVLFMFNNEALFVFRVLKFNLFYEYSFELIEKETERVERVNAKSKH